MPKKSDRSNHGSAFSNLFPDVGLEEEAEAPSDEATSGDASPDEAISDEAGGDSSGSAQTATEPNPGSVESGQAATFQQNPSSTEPKDSQGSRRSAPSTEPEPAASQPSPRQTPVERLQRRPDQRPDLDAKLGPYVSEEVRDALDDVYYVLRRRYGKSASKSLLVDVALRFCLADYAERGDDSALVRYVEEIAGESERG